MPLGEQLMMLPTLKIVATTSCGKRWFLLLIGTSTEGGHALELERTFHIYFIFVTGIIVSSGMTARRVGARQSPVNKMQFVPTEYLPSE